MKRGLRLLLVVLILFLAASSAFSLALRGGWARRALLARLSASFGRPVEVGQFGFSLLSGFRFEAQSVTIAEDPRFGQEYFLRSDELTASLRWSALARGRFELQTISLSHPSLNLVRLSDGQWNIESWLPPLPRQDERGANRVIRSEPAPSASTARFARVQVNSGRINFKRDDRKLPIALTAVNGHLDYDVAGHWNLDLQAKPLRVPAALQQAGTLRLRGTVGGVSARLRPASLELGWEDASLADLSRLLFGADYGVRGSFGGELSAKIAYSPSQSAAQDWVLEGKLGVQGVHGWALPTRSGDPGVVATFQGVWNPSEYRVRVTKVSLESPQSHVRAVVSLDWSNGFSPGVIVTSAHLSFAELLAWRRAFSSGAENLTAEGTLDAVFSGSGWPMRIENLSIQSSGASMNLPQVPQPIRIGDFSAEWVRGSLNLQPVSLALPSLRLENSRSESLQSFEQSSERADVLRSPNILRLEGSIGPFDNLKHIHEATYLLKISGATQRAGDFLALGTAWRPASGWSLSGPVSLQLVLKGVFDRPGLDINGSIQGRDVEVSTPVLNEPVLISSGTMEFKGSQKTLKLISAQALGANWTGMLYKSSGNENWVVDLTADRLDSSEFNAWLGAQPRPNLLRRMLPFGGLASTLDAQDRTDALAGLHARGRLRVGEITFAKLIAEKLDSQLILDGPSLVLTQGHAAILDGQFSGDFQAQLSAQPSFTFSGRFDRIDLRELSELAALPAELGGSGSGELQLAAYGADRSAIVSSLQGKGVLRVRDAWSQVQWPEFAPANSTMQHSPASNSPFTVAAGFQVGGSRIRFDEAQISTSTDQLNASGTIDFTRRVDLRIRSFPRNRKIAPIESRIPAGWTVTGTLDAPRIESTPVPDVPIGTPLASR